MIILIRIIMMIRLLLLLLLLLFGYHRRGIIDLICHNMMMMMMILIVGMTTHGTVQYIFTTPKWEMRYNSIIRIDNRWVLFRCRNGVRMVVFHFGNNSLCRSDDGDMYRRL